MAEQYGAAFMRYLVEAFNRQDIDPSANQMVGLLEDLETNGYRIVDCNGVARLSTVDDPMFAEVETMPVPAPYDPDAAFFRRLYVVIADDAGYFRTEEFDRSKISDWTIEPERTVVSALVESYSRDEAMRAFGEWRKGNSTYAVSKKTIDGVTFYYLSDEIPF